ncbi:MAG: YkgJ family cysteine cluster protein [Chrysiogenales bacterium]|nr:MAG: YkgJ family cysteine cluster protein [Chrysiogenales bacterium]
MAGIDSRHHAMSILLEREMKCLQCGNCCHVDMIAYVTASDSERWEREGRNNILKRLLGENILWAGDIIVSSDGKRLKSCVFLNHNGNSFFCEIYDTRPGICRDYKPGSSTLCPLYYTLGA